MEGPNKVHLQINVTKNNNSKCFATNNKQKPLEKLGCDLSFDKCYNVFHVLVLPS